MTIFLISCGGKETPAPDTPQTDSIALQHLADSIVAEGIAREKKIIIDSVALMHEVDTLVYDTTFYAGAGGAHDTLSPYFYRLILRCVLPRPNTASDIVCDTIRRAMTHFLTGYLQSDMIKCAPGSFGMKVLQYKDEFRKASKEERKESFAIMEQRKARLIREDDDMMCVAFLSTVHNMAVRRIPKIQQSFIVFDKHTGKRMTLTEWLPPHKQEQVRSLIISRLLSYYNISSIDSLTYMGVPYPEGIVVSQCFLPSSDSLLFAYEPDQLCDKRKFVALSYEELQPFGEPRALMTKYIAKKCKEKEERNRPAAERIDTTLTNEMETQNIK